MDGILNINKPRGITSYAVVARVKKLTGERRVGHAGTLDPEATGVLPVCLGRATRIIEFLGEAPKTYRAEIELGVETDTFDAAGKVLERKDATRIERAELDAILPSFRGEIAQYPPMYSALKYHGRPLYQMARAGMEIERPERTVTIYNLEVIAWQSPLFTLIVKCSRGTYIRSLAHDIGQRLGCGAHIKTLDRERYGIFYRGEAISLEGLAEAAGSGYWQDLVYPMDTVLCGWSALIVGEATGRAIINGNAVSAPNPREETHCRVYDRDGGFLGVLRFQPETSRWHPAKILNWRPY